MSAANKDEARRCLEVARANLASGSIDKAHRFAEKAMKLFPDDEACHPSISRQWFAPGT